MSDYGAWAATRLRDGHPLEAIDTSRVTGVWLEFVGACRSANGTDRRIVFDHWIDRHPNRSEIIQRMFAVRPDADAPFVDGGAGRGGGHHLYDIAVDVPALPDIVTDAERQAGRRAGAWIDEYVDWAHRLAALTPRVFHESAALWLIGLTIARRVRLPLANGNIFPNQYTIWVAESSLYAKSTGVELARRVAREADVLHLIMPTPYTVASLYTDMRGKEPANYALLEMDTRQQWDKGRQFAAYRGILQDEITDLIRLMFREHNVGFEESVMKFYDCVGHSHTTKGEGLTRIESSYLSIMGATTPAALKDVTGNRFWLSGMWARTALLVPDERPVLDVGGLGEVAVPGRLAGQLRQLYGRLPGVSWPNEPMALNATISERAFEIYSTYSVALRRQVMNETDERLHGIYGRQAVKLLKVATTLAAMDWRDEAAPRIEAHHMARALDIVERWRASLYRLNAYWTNHRTLAVEAKIRMAIENSGAEGVTLRELYRPMEGGRGRQRVEMVVKELVEAGDVEPVPYRNPSGGAPTTRYRIKRGGAETNGRAAH